MKAKKKQIYHFSIVLLMVSFIFPGCGSNRQEPPAEKPASTEDLNSVIKSSEEDNTDISSAETDNVENDTPQTDQTETIDSDADIAMQNKTENDDPGAENSEPACSGSNESGIISSLREYLYPGNDIARFYVEDGNFNERMSMVEYDAFDVSAIISHLYGTLQTTEEQDRDKDGETDACLFCYADNNFLLISDTNGDGNVDRWSVDECNNGVHNDFQVIWTDADHNGTVDQLDTIIAFPDDVENARFSVKYTYGDFIVTNWDTGECDYQNKGRIQIAIMDSIPIYSQLKISQFFRDFDADGYVDQIVRWTWYDTNYDGVDDSMKIETDNNVDGIFEDSYAFDGKILENSLLY